NVLFIFLGGGLGSLCRYGVSKLSVQYFAGNFPLGTFIANILSCIVLSFSVIWLNDKMGTSASLKLFLITGFCGGFSTFSTFSVETVELLKTGHYVVAVLNIGLSVMVGVGLIYFLLKNQ